MAGNLGRFEGPGVLPRAWAMKPDTATWIKRTLVNLGLTVQALVILQACTEHEPSHESIIRQDLLTIIETLGSPCEQVSEFEPTTEFSYSVTCETGDRYRISVNPEGRIHIKEHDSGDQK